MNFNIRESNLLTWAAFPSKNSDGEDWAFAYFISALLNFIASFIANLILFAGPLSLSLNWLWLTVPLTFLSFVLLPHANKLHKGYGLKSYYTGNGPLDYAQKYWSLSEADKALFPSNIIETLKDPHLSDAQERQLLSEMSNVFQSIRERDDALADAKSKEIDVSGVLEEMQRNRKSLDVETSTYREML